MTSRDRYFGVGKAVEGFTSDGHGKQDIDLMAVGIMIEPIDCSS
jgi:hypothetical protein